MRRLIPRPSPGVILGLVALFFALGGSAYGALVITGKNVRNGSLSGRDIKNGSLASRDMKRNSLGSRAVAESKLGLVPSAGVAEGLSHHAVVNAAGLLARGRGVSSVARTGAGRYQVIFNRDVRGCAYLASLGDAGAANPPLGQVSTSALASNVAGVAVRTTTSNGNDTNRSFHLALSC
jgi:hypothetical protein